MYKVNDKVVYKREVCTIKEIKTSNGNEYYVLTPIDDKSLTIDILSTNKLGWLRPIMSKKEVERIIQLIPDIEVISIPNEKLIEQEYKNLLRSNKYEDLIKIIKTTYARNQGRIDNNKKTSDKDTFYFDKAERMLYNEFAIALDKTYEETKEYVAKKVEECCK